MYDIGISEIAVTAKYEDTEDTEDILKKFMNPKFNCHNMHFHRIIYKRAILWKACL